MEMRRRDFEDELDAKLSELFRAVDPPAPAESFVARTMDAVRAERPPAGREALRRWWAAPLGWAALVAAASAAAAAILAEPMASRAFVSMLDLGLRAGVQLAHLITAGLAASELLATISGAFARAAATREGLTTLLVTGVVAAASLSALQRLLGWEREVAQWEELS
jgi:hypothetical protein